MHIPVLRRTDHPSHKEMSVKYKGWLSQGAVISLCKPKGGDGWQYGDSGKMRSVQVECYVRGYHVYQPIWNPFMSKVAITVREERNTHDH